MKIILLLVLSLLGVTPTGITQPSLEVSVENATPRSYHFMGPQFEIQTNNPKAFEPGVYGRTKHACMFISYREWDGEMRLAGVLKDYSVPWTSDHESECQVEIEGVCSNNEHVLFGRPTNIIISTNYTGTIQIGTNHYTIKDIQKLSK